jgi:hypothetical protein
MHLVGAIDSGCRIEAISDAAKLGVRQMDPDPDELANAITLLLGDSEEGFPHERELRMFQFQCWLLDSQTQDASFQRSARIFATAVLSTAISRTRAKNNGLSMRERLLLATASKNMDGLINFCFRRRHSLYSLLAIDNFPLRRSEHDHALEEIADLNDLVEARVRLHLSSEPPGLNAGERLLPKLKPGSRRRTGLSQVHRKRVKREPFLFAAKCVAPEFLAMDFESTGGKNRLITPGGLLSQVTEKAKNRDAFDRLCRVAKAIAPVISVAWSAEVANALAAVEPELPAVEPIPAGLLPKKIPRRPAPETKRAIRQQVGI